MLRALLIERFKLATHTERRSGQGFALVLTRGDGRLGERLADLTNKPAKSLHRMLSKHGNPSMDNLAVIFDAVRQRMKVELKAQAVKAA